MISSSGRSSTRKLGGLAASRPRLPGMPEAVAHHHQHDRPDDEWRDEEDVLRSRQGRDDAEQEDRREIERVLLHLCSPKMPPCSITGTCRLI